MGPINPINSLNIEYVLRSEKGVTHVGNTFNSFTATVDNTVKPRWLEHRWLVYYG